MSHANMLNNTALQKLFPISL